MRIERIAYAGLMLASALVLCPSVHADVDHKQINEVTRITYVSEDAWQPEGFVNGIPVPAVYLPSADITMDGKDSEPEWQKAIEVIVPLQYGGTEEVMLKAMYTRDEVFIRVRWPDDTENRNHHPWTWDSELERYVEGPEIEDSVLLSFEAGCEWTPSLLGGYIYDFDAWQWMAARSDPLGQALDLYGNVQDREMGNPNFKTYQSRVLQDAWNLKFTENRDVDMVAQWNELDRVYMMQPVTETLHIRAIPDGGPQSPPFIQQLPPPATAPDDKTQVYPQFSPVKLTGSAAEVSARGQWENGFWTVEFRRDRETPVEHIYDTIFNRLIQFSVHVFDQTERVDEVSESPRLFLQFLPEETQLVARD
jgi:hypothetical protein